MAQLVDVMKRLSSSPQGSRDAEVFSAMLRLLFYECRYFTKYPPQELLTTAELFGQLIRHDVLLNQGNALSMALRCVIEALRKGAASKMFRFGLTALEQVGRLVGGLLW